MREQHEGSGAGKGFITSVVLLIPQIKITRDGIATDNHKIMSGHAYLPLTCICLAWVCGQLFLPGSASQTNNEGQTELCV